MTGTTTQPSSNDLARAYLRQAAGTKGDPFEKSWRFKPATSEAGQQILEADLDLQVSCLSDLYHTAIAGGPTLPDPGYENFGSRSWNWNSSTEFDRQVRARTMLASEIVKKKRAFTSAHLRTLIELAVKATKELNCLYDDRPTFPIAPLVSRLEDFCEKTPPDDLLRQRISDLSKAALGFFLTEWGAETATGRRFAARLEALGQDETAPEPLVKPGEAWSDKVLGDLERMAGPTRSAWVQLINHAATTPSKPTKKWRSKALELSEQLGLEELVARLSCWLPLVAKAKKVTQGEPDWHGMVISDEHQTVLLGLAWTCAGHLDDGRIVALVGQLAQSCYHKVPQVGPRSVRVGTGCLQVLAESGDRASVQQLSALKARFRKPSLRGKIEKVLDQVAERAGLSADDLEDMAVPDFGLDVNGTLEESFGSHCSHLELHCDSVSLSWKDTASNTLLKSVPAAVRKARPDEVKALKARAKELDKQRRLQRDRLDLAVLQGRRWTLGSWLELSRHALMRHLVGGLVWRFESNGSSIDAAFLADHLVDLQGTTVEPDPDSMVRLWHPMDSSPHEVARWRQWVLDNRITQPLKQVYRESYQLTDAERTTGSYSNRFAGHILKQHQLKAVGETRGWQSTLHGAWDGGYNPPKLRIPSRNLRVELGIGFPGGGLSEARISLYISSADVRIYPLDGKKPLSLAEIEPIVFSEIMRNVDLLVSVSSIGADPDWPGSDDPAFAKYWQDHRLGALSTIGGTRRELLEQLVPRLPFADRLDLGERFLEVRSSDGVYRIHLGSGQVLLAGQERTPELIPDAKLPLPDVALPWQGDEILERILKQATVLAQR